jgi:hypothetical protein
MVVHLTSELEEALTEKARQQGTTPELLALDVLREHLLISPEIDSDENEGSLADFLTGYIGVIHSSEQVPGGARMSENGGKKFAEGLQRKRQMGRL